MSEAEMVNGAFQLESAFRGIRCHWRKLPYREWGIAVYRAETGRYLFNVSRYALIQDMERITILFELCGITRR